MTTMKKRTIFVIVLICVVSYYYNTNPPCYKNTTLVISSDLYYSEKSREWANSPRNTSNPVYLSTDGSVHHLYSGETICTPSFLWDCNAYIDKCMSEKSHTGLTLVEDFGRTEALSRNMISTMRYESEYNGGYRHHKRYIDLLYNNYFPYENDEKGGDLRFILKKLNCWDFSHLLDRSRSWGPGTEDDFVDCEEKSDIRQKYFRRFADRYLVHAGLFSSSVCFVDHESLIKEGRVDTMWSQESCIYRSP
jgi:hypothetical protein